MFYDCRTNTIILVDHSGNCEYIERTLTTPVNVDNPDWKTLTQCFKIDVCE